MTTATATRRGSSGTRPIYVYFGTLTFLLYLVLPEQYPLDIATSYMLKNQLHATAPEVSSFRLLTAIPVYVAFLFGLARDLWNPFHLKDRGFFLLFAPFSAAVFLWMALSDISYQGLLIGMLLTMVSLRLVAAAYQALLALVGQEQVMSGRLSALWNLVQSIPLVAGALASGYLIEHLSPRQIFAIVAGLTLLIALLGLWKPRAIFSHAYDRPQAQGAGFVGDVRRLIKHRAIYPAVLIMFMFQFSPGSSTPLQYYLTNELHAADSAYAYYNGIFLASFMPMYVLYGYLCRRVALRKLLWWGLIITVPQMLPLAFVHSVDAALLLAVPIGLMGGIAFAAINDLAMRSCPPGLQGTLMMLVAGAYQLSWRGGDLLGAAIYANNPGHGFLYCVLATTAVYALILPVLLFVPKELTATADGEPNPQLEAQTLAEIGVDAPKALAIEGS